VEEGGIEVQTGALSGIFAAPQWMRDLGFSAWLLVGVAAALAFLAIGAAALRRRAPLGAGSARRMARRR
jgi:hypothetical protein